MVQNFGKLPSGQMARLYTISCGGITAVTTDLGAALVSLHCPDREGNVDDVVLGYDTPEGYLTDTCFLGATVGRNANRIGGAFFRIGGRSYSIPANENLNNLHSGPDFYKTRLWDARTEDENEVTFTLLSPDGDQGFPGKAEISVTYRLDGKGALHILYDAVADRDTIFNLTNHSYFNLAGQSHPEKAAGQLLTIPGRHFCPDDDQNIPTGQRQRVADTPMDFRAPRPVTDRIDEDFTPLILQGGYDHNFEVFCNPCAILYDPESGRQMAVSTDLPGIQFYAGNYLNETGKGGVYYGKHSGIALETQFYPDAIHKPHWVQPVFKAGQHFRSETVYRFTVE